MSCKTGIYKLINKITEDFYIGSASRIGKSNSLSGFYVRFDKHKGQLNNNSHSCIMDIKHNRTFKDIII